MSAIRRVRLYLDFVSPYVWLALHRVGEIGRRHGVEWDLHPVVYAALLGAHDLLGPAETPAKRRYMVHDVARAARRAGMALAGPPRHPFRSLEALRVLTVFRSEPGALDLARRLSHAAWGAGRSLEEMAVLEEVVRDAGLDAGNLAGRIAEPGVKQELRRLTDEALARGVFGVPTFEHEGRFFWGHDRLDHLEDDLAGRLPAYEDVAEELLSRPVGVHRRPPRQGE